MRKSNIYKKAIKEAEQHLLNAKIDMRKEQDIASKEILRTAIVHYEFILEMIRWSIKKGVEERKRLNKEFRKYVKREK